MIRKMVSADREAILEIGQQVIDQPDLFPFEQIEGVANYWFSQSSSCYVFEHEERVVGSYVLKPILPDRGNHVANAGYMVNRSARRLGIGKKMALHSIQQARQLGYHAMQFNIVVASNLPAVNLWKSVGFQVVGTVPKAFRVTESLYADLLIMHRTL